MIDELQKRSDEELSFVDGVEDVSTVLRFQSGIG